MIYGTIEYDADSMSWVVNIGHGKILGKILTNKFQRQCAHYYAFTAFSKLDDDQLAEIKENVAEKRKAKGALADDRKALKKHLSDFRYANKETDNPWPEASPFADDGNEASWPMSTIKFSKKADKESDYIRYFYHVLIENI